MLAVFNFNPAFGFAIEAPTEPGFHAGPDAILVNDSTETEPVTARAHHTTSRGEMGNNGFNVVRLHVPRFFLAPVQNNGRRRSYRDWGVYAGWAISGDDISGHFNDSCRRSSSIGEQYAGDAANAGIRFIDQSYGDDFYLWSMSGVELGSAELEGFPHLSQLTAAYAPQGESETSNNDRGDSGDGAVIRVNKRSDTPQIMPSVAEKRGEEIGKTFWILLAGVAIALMADTGLKRWRE